MKLISTSLKEVLLIDQDIFIDDRGFFLECFNHQKFEQLLGRKIAFVQDNQSKSYKGVLRGIHFQNPKPQAKLIRVLRGAIFDVVVDVRENSPTLGEWTSSILSSDNKLQKFIPEGFAHGFLTLTDSAEILYKTTDYYAPEYESCILWNDLKLNINWPIDSAPILSSKDRNGQLFSEIELI